MTLCTKEREGYVSIAIRKMEDLSIKKIMLKDCIYKDVSAKKLKELENEVTKVVENFYVEEIYYLDTPIRIGETIKNLEAISGYLDKIDDIVNKDSNVIAILKSRNITGSVFVKNECSNLIPVKPWDYIKSLKVLNKQIKKVVPPKKRGRPKKDILENNSRYYFVEKMKNIYIQITDKPVYRRSSGARTKVDDKSEFQNFIYDCLSQVVVSGQKTSQFVKKTRKNRWNF